MNPQNPLFEISWQLTANLVEAIIGAVSLDGSDEDVRTVMTNLGISLPPHTLVT